MKREYQKPDMTVLQVQLLHLLLSGSDDVQNLDESNGLKYRGSDADYYDDDAR